VGLNAEFRGHVESICAGGLLGLLSRTQDKVWDFFQKVAWDTDELEQPRGTLGYRTYDEHVFLANPHNQGHFINSYNHQYYSYVPPILWDYCWVFWLWSFNFVWFLHNCIILSNYDHLWPVIGLYIGVVCMVDRRSKGVNLYPSSNAVIPL